MSREQTWKKRVSTQLWGLKTETLLGGKKVLDCDKVLCVPRLQPRRTGSLRQSDSERKRNRGFNWWERKDDYKCRPFQNYKLNSLLGYFCHYMENYFILLKSKHNIPDLCSLWLFKKLLMLLKLPWIWLQNAWLYSNNFLTVICSWKLSWYFSE